MAIKRTQNEETMRMLRRLAAEAGNEVLTPAGARRRACQESNWLSLRRAQLY